MAILRSGVQRARGWPVAVARSSTEKEDPSTDASRTSATAVG